MAEQARGQCLCGAVRYVVDGPMRDVTACHCKQCQRSAGSYFMATSAKRADITIDNPEQTLTWFRDPSTNFAERGFCNRCGSSLFWQRDRADTLSITAGTLDAPNNLKLTQHIFVDYKGGYYSLTDGLPQYPEYPGYDPAIKPAHSND